MSNFPQSTEGLFPSRISTNPLDRPGMALSNLAHLRPGAAVRSLVAPGTLSPTEQRTLADDLGITEDSGPLAFILRTVTNPLVLAGAILATRYPIPLAREMFKYGEKLTGMARKVGPLTRTVGNIDEIYAGLNIPENYKKLLSTVHEYKVTKANELTRAIQEAVKGGLTWDQRTQVLLAAKLDGLDKARKGAPALFRPINEGPAFDRLVKDSRKILNGIWDDTLGDKAKQKLLTERAYLRYLGRDTRATIDRLAELEKYRKEGVPLGKEARYSLLEKKEAALSTALKRKVNSFLRGNFFEVQGGFYKEVPKLDDYFPHQIARGTRQYEAEIKALQEVSSLGQRAYGESAVRTAQTMAPRSALSRQGLMAPDLEDLKLVEDYLDPGVYKNLQSKMSGIGAEVRPYSLKFTEVMGSYFHTNAKAIGWTLTEGKYGKKKVPLGMAIAQETADLEKAGGSNAVRASMMKQSYIPLALGRKSFDTFQKAAKWSADKIKAAEFLDDPAIKSIVPETMRTSLQDALRKDTGLLSLQNISGRAAGWLYGGALGANPVSAAYNLMQSLITTVPTIGPKATLEGLKSTLSKSSAYFKARSKGLLHEEAIAAAFPDYKASGLATISMLDDPEVQALQQAWEMSLGLPTGIQKTLGNIKSGMMVLFTGTENLNRMTAFEGAKWKALKEGLSLEEALPFARRVTEATQYLSGPASTPGALLNWNPLGRQFLQFPMRTLGFMGITAPELGSGAQSGLFGRNWGTLGRVAATTGIAYEAGRTLLGKDISHGLAFGALPVPQENAPFYPAPFVPPALSIGGALASDLLKGEWDKSKYALPMLVPGGLTASRLLPAISQEAAQTMGRGYADYEKRTPDGRVPVYTATGSLRGYYTDMQIWSEVLGGFGGPSSKQTEQELMGYLMKQRDRIRMYRREFLDAVILRNDMDEAQEIQEEFQAAYPMLPGLTYTEQDRKAVEMRASVSRLEQMLDSLPTESRAAFGQVIATAMTAQAQEFLGVDPLLFREGGTSRSRDPYRLPTPTGALDAMMRAKVDMGLAPEYGAGQVGNVGMGSRPTNVPRSNNPFFPRATVFGSFGGGGAFR